MAFGLASSIYIEKKPPVDPSARNQFSDGAVTPALLWPPLNALLPVLRYIERSTMIGTPLVEVISADTSVARRAWSSWSTQMVKRLPAPTL